MKKIPSSKMTFFALAVLFIWIKSYAIYLIEFNLDVQGTMQHFLLFINPISSSLIFLGIALFARGKRVGNYIFLIHLLMSALIYSNVVYYRFNSDFITLPLLTQTGNFGSLGGSILNLMQWTDLFYATDIVILFVLLIKMKPVFTGERMSLKKPLMIIAVGVLAFTVNLGLAETDRPELLKRTFDRNYIVKYLGAYDFVIYDAIQNVKSSTQRVLADSNDVVGIKDYTRGKNAQPDEELFGIAEGKNVIKIHLESLQSFLINFELNGEEVTPFLNSLVNDESENYTYFENFFHQTEQGKTADAELIMDNSIYGLPQGSAFVTKGKNTYQALPDILGQKQDYTSTVFHGDYKSFWNRDEIYKQFGIDHYFDASFYDMNDDNVLNYGLKDKPFFKESMPILESLKNQNAPFYAHMMTLTHHYPYLIDEEDATIDPAETGDKSVDRYFQTARYMDEALEQFFTDLKNAGLYDDSVILLYGDHYGISDNHTRALEEILDEEMTPYNYANLQRVPLLIKVPGMEGKGTVSEYGGQVDVMPTLMHLLGINTKDYLLFGTDLFSKDHDDLVAFRNGDFFSEDYAMVKGTFYDNQTGEELESNDTLEGLQKKVANELKLSDELLQGDLFRFYTPDSNWDKINPKDYHYGEDSYDVPNYLKVKWLGRDYYDEPEALNSDDQDNSNTEQSNDE